MKNRFSLFLCFAVVVLLFIIDDEVVEGHPRAIRAVQKYTNKYDKIDIDSILASRRLLFNYINCLLGKGSCSPEGKLLKEIVPDALATNCVKCTDVQKKQAGHIFSFLLLNYRDQWDQLIAKYDPNGNYRTMYHIDEDYDYSDLDSAK